MKNNLEAPEPDVNDHREIEESLELLDRTTDWFWWITVAMIVLILVAISALFELEVVTRFDISRQLHIIAFVSALLVTLLVSNGYLLYRQHHFKLFRMRLADQMQVTVKHRLRADKFYGLAIVDPLTGMYNRRFGEESLQKEITRAAESRGDLAVIAVDLDYFKAINDRFGHAAGDLVLKEFSRHLRRAIRECDLPVRIGGDEFLVILPECSRENVQLILSRLKPFEVLLNREKHTISYSRGHAQYQVGDTPKAITQRADKLLYAEKAGRSTTAL